jgi:Zn-dependent protease
MVLIALMFHELAHGFVSIKLGDPTPRMQGRMTLNPLAHLDLVGTILMIFTGFGWAKPVQINPRYYKDPKKGMVITALAGPLMNFILAILAMLLYGIYFIIVSKTGLMAGAMYSVGYLVMRFVTLNLCFMVFNFIPIPPLDGSRILYVFLPPKYYFGLMKYERYVSIALLLLLWLGIADIPLAYVTARVSDAMTFIINLIPLKF